MPTDPEREPDAASCADCGPETFRLGFAPGVSPGKWVRGWQARMREPIEPVPTGADGVAALHRGDLDAAVLRLPVDRTGLSVIPLYEEVAVVVVPVDHVVTAVDEVAAADVAEETVLHPLDDPFRWDGPPGVRARERPATTADAVALVAAGVGLLVTPMSLARLHHRKDVTYRPLTDGPGAPVGLVWVADRTTDLVEELIGVIRGRTPNSTRGRAGADGSDGGTQRGKQSGGKQAKAAQSGGKQSGNRRAADRRAAGLRKAGRDARAGGRGGKRGRR
ncbi:MAG: LysR substrate-binding domain-containing protein [Cellulomonadaceae bacterium]